MNELKPDADGRVFIHFHDHEFYSSIDFWPLVCCGCLSREAEHWKLEVSLPKAIKIPICTKCRKRHQQHARSIDFLCGVTAITVGTLVFVFLPREIGSLLERVLVAMLVMVVVLMATLFLVRRSRYWPIRYFSLRPKEGIMIQFMNRDFVDLLRRSD